MKNNVRYTNETFTTKANEIHNNEYDYSKVDYVNNRTKVCIICKEHGEFWQRPDAHLRGDGCPGCRYIKSSRSNKTPLDEFKRRATEVHNGKYSYEKTEDFKNQDAKVIITCPIHGDFRQTPHHHLNGIGCPVCGSKTYDTEEFIRRAKEKHGDKYDYSKTVFGGKRKKVTIICPVHGEFQQLPLNHLDGRGCKFCGTKYGISELRVLKALEDASFNVIYQYTAPFLKVKKKPMYLDFFLPEYNVAIEYQGEQHFRPTAIFGGKDAFDTVSERDKRKFRLCEENGIRLLYISFERNVPSDYISTVFTNTSDLIAEIRSDADQHLSS